MQKIPRAFFFLLLFLSLFLGSFFPKAFALLKFEDAVFPELATGGRPLAMGNAFICKVDDSNAVYYNPAGLGTIRWTHLHLTNIHLETNKGLIDVGSEGNIATVPGKALKGFSVEGSRQLLLENRGVLTHNRFNILPNLTTRYFSMGFLLSQQARATIGSADDANFEFAKRQDLGPYGAVNLSLFGGVVKIGASGTYLYRKEIFDERDKDTAVDLEDSEYKKGKAFILTAGTRVTLPIVFLPTVAATFHNALGTEFSGGAGAGAPDKIRETVDVGFSLTPQIGNSVRVHLEMNYKDATGEFPEVSTARKVLFGLEFDFGRVMFVRAGYGDGFGSGGIGIKSKRLEFDMTTYAVDTTSSEFRGVEDRRFAMTISSGI